MPGKRKKNKRFIKIFILATGFITLAAFSIIFYSWWQSRRAPFITYEEFGIPIPSNYIIHGIDVSRYQNRIEWQAVQQMNVNGVKMGFAFIKATEGVERVDPFFKRNWNRSKDAGIIRGAYHFFLASKDGREQAKNFIDAVKLSKGDLPPVLDVEQTFGQTPDKLRKEVKKWLDIVEEYYEVQPIIYTGAEFYKKYLKGHFDEYPLWVAHYLQPHQPRINRDWSFWQHSEQGRVNGIAANVDFNVFNGDSLDFKALLVP